MRSKCAQRAEKRGEEREESRENIAKLRRRGQGTPQGVFEGRRGEQPNGRGRTGGGEGGGGGGGPPGCGARSSTKSLKSL